MSYTISAGPQAFLGLRWVENPTGLDVIEWSVSSPPEGRPADDDPLLQAWRAAEEASPADEGEAEERYVAVLKQGNRAPTPFYEMLRQCCFLRLASFFEPMQAWPTLMLAFGPENSPRLVPSDFASDWAEQVARLAPEVEEWSVLASATVFLFQLAVRLQSPRAQAALERLQQLRDRCFESLEGLERADFAEQVCDQMSMAQDEAGLARWEALAEEAAREATPPAWNLTAEADWSDPERIAMVLNTEPPPDLSQAGPALQKYQEAAALSDRNQLQAGLDAYRAALSELRPSNPVQELLRAMMLWGKATNLDRLGQLEAAWQTLGEVFSPGKRVRLPLRFFVSWLQSSVIVAARSGRAGAAAVLLTLLYELVSRELPEAHDHLLETFSELINGTVERLARPDPEAGLAWLDEYGPRFSPDGKLPPALLALRFDLLTHMLRFEEALAIAGAMIAEARATGDSELEEDWRQLEQDALEQAQDPYNLARLDRLGELADVDAVGEKGRTALMGAARSGNLVLARRLLAQGADPNAEDPYDWTPLLLAADEGHAEMVRLLAEHGADLQAVTEQDQTALHLASWQNHLETAQVLLELGVDATASDQDGNTALHLAATEPAPEMIRLLAARVGVDIPNAQTEGTPLMSAAASGLVENLQLLLGLGAALEARDVDGDRALEYARLHGREGAIMFLREQEA